MDLLPRLDTVGDRIRFLRKELIGASQKDFSQRLKEERVPTSYGALRRYESGEREPPLGFLRDLGHAFRLNAGWLACTSRDLGLFAVDGDTVAEWAAQVGANGPYLDRLTEMETRGEQVVRGLHVGWSFPLDAAENPQVPQGGEASDVRAPGSGAFGSERAEARYAEFRDVEVLIQLVERAESDEARNGAIQTADNIIEDLRPTGAMSAASEFAWESFKRGIRAARRTGEGVPTAPSGVASDVRDAEQASDAADAARRKDPPLPEAKQG